MAPPFPADWDDDERMSFLFSAFKGTRDVDSADWDSKMAFWIPLIVQHVKAEGLVRVTLRQLQSHFARKGSTPLGLGTVVREMLRRGALQQEADYVSGIASGWILWGMRQLVIRPLRWTWGTVLGGQINPDEPFLIPEALKDQAELVLQKYQSSPLSSSPLLLEDDVHALCKEVIPDQAAMRLVMLQLQREKKICVLQQDGQKLVKFVQGGSSHVTPIGETDLGVYELRKSEALLSERLKKACEECDRLKEEAISFKRAGNKHQALRCLRRRKLAEKRLAELQNKLDTIQSILERMSMAETDRMVVSAYQLGVSALRSALKDVNLEKTEHLVDQIQEYCDLQDDINQTLAGPGDLDVDTDELERELDEILQNNVVDLPTVPTGPLITPPQKVSGEQNNGASDISQVLDLPDVPVAFSPASPSVAVRDRDTRPETTRFILQ